MKKIFFLLKDYFLCIINIVNLKKDSPILRFFSNPFSKSSDPDLLFRSYILYLSLLVIIVTCLILAVLSFFFSSQSDLVMSVGSSLVFIFLYLVFRSGKILATSVLECLYLYFISFYAIVTGDGIHDVVIVLIPVFLLVISLLNKSLFYWLFVSLFLLTTLVIGILEIQGVIENRFLGMISNVDIPFLFTLLLLTSILLRYMSKILYRLHGDKVQQDKKYALIFNTVEEAIFLLDGDSGDLQDVNQGMLTMYQYEKDEIIGKNIGHFGSNQKPYTQIDAMNYIKRAQSIGPQHFPWEAKKKDGTLFWVDVNLRSFQFDGKKQLIATAKDINQLRDMEKEIQQADKLRALGQLAGGIAHDFNNQLTGIRGFSELLEDEITPEEKKEYLTMIVKSVDRASDLTEKLLSFARKGRQLNQIVNMNKLIMETIQMLNRGIDRRIKIIYSEVKGDFLVSGNESQLQNALLNLGLNSRDAIIDRGEIYFILESFDLFPDQINEDKSLFVDLIPGEYVHIQVSDTGSGISDSLKEKIFEPFFTTKLEGKGTGLGLSAVYGTVKQHGGIIILDNSMQRTTFHIYLPRYSGS